MQWVWAPVAGDRETTFTFDLPDMALDPAGAPDEVEVEFFFYHWRQEQLGANYLPASMRKCRIEINGYAAHEISFAGGDDERKTIAISRSLLKSSGNFVGMRLRSAQDGSSLDRLAEGTYFDRLTVEYPRAPMAQDGEAALIVHEDDLQTSDTFAIGGFGAETPLAIFEPAGRAPDALQVFLPAGAKRQIRAVEIARIASAPALVPASTADWRAADRQADYLIISHPDFIDLLEPLAEKRRQQGMLAEIVDVFDLYDGFSHGEPTPYAIKRFLLHALLHWKIPPTYVLLVGDSTSDYRGLMREPVQNWTPTYRPETTPRFEAQWASDHWFATLLGDDEYPDVLVGRLSTNSREDAREAIRKALAAAEGLPPGPWRNRALLVADNEIEFPEACETVRLKDLPPWVFVDRVYMDEMPWERNFYLEQSDVAAEDMKVSSHATQRIVDAFKEGVGFIGFFGHGSPNIWTDERIWFGGDSPNSDNLLLRNGDRMPFVAAWTCNNGAIDYPAPRWNVCIAEDMMRVRQGGSHGIFAPTGPGGTESHSRLSSQLIRALYREGPARQGDAIALAKTRALLVPGLNDYARMYLLLGDPAAPFLCPRNQLDISVEPYYAAQSQKSLRVSARNAPAPQGRIVFRLANPSGEGREDIQAYDFSQDKPDYLLPLPGALERGEWRLQAYFWDEASGLDAAGHAPFVVETPFAELESFSADTDRADGKTALALNLKNPSLAPIQGLKFDVREKQGYRLAVVCSGQEDLAPGESKTWEHFWEAPPGAHELSARLLNFDGSPLADRAPAAKREISFSIPAPADSPRFALSAYDLRQEFRRVEADAEMEASVSVLLTAGEWSGPLEVGWGWADEIASTATVAFSADNRAKSTAAKFYLTAPLADLPKPFFLEIDPFRKVLSADEPPVRLHSRMDAKALPNLVFSREGVATDPASPSDGQTVFFHVGVKNEGQASAGRFRVAAYGSDPNQGGEPLPNRAGAPHWECEGLAPNAETKALIRWDPGQNAGEHRIYFWIDSQNRIMESDENDNLRYFPLRVRTLADLKPQAVTFDTPPSELGRLRLHVNASVRNDGETEARNVMFQFYSDREGNPENKLGEPRLVPVIKPGETHTETYVWQLPPTFREDLEKPDFSISACAQVYLKGSLQRVVVAHRSYLEND